MGGFVATVESVTDGDTIVTTADLMPLLALDVIVRHKIRLLGVNAPERNTPAGQAAKKWLTDLAAGKDCLVAIDRLDKYGGRVNGHVWLAGDTVDLSQRVIDAGHGKPWDGKGRRP